MSSGETEFKSPGIPSIKTSGLALAFRVVIPLREISDVDVGFASGVMMLKPGTCPLISWAGSVDGVFDEIFGFDRRDCTCDFSFFLSTIANNDYFI